MLIQQRLKVWQGSKQRKKTREIHSTRVVSDTFVGAVLFQQVQRPGLQKRRIADSGRRRRRRVKAIHCQVNSMK